MTYAFDKDKEHYRIDIDTGEIREGMAKLTLTDSYIGIEGIYSKDVDEEFYGEDINDKENIDLGSDDDEIVTRGEIKDFSRASQARLIKAVSIWDPAGTLLIITLTYPAKWPSGERCQADFKAFRQRLLEKRPDWSGCWKLEYQTRGAPHYHLIIDSNVDRINLKNERRFINSTWKKARRSNVPARTQCDLARNKNKAKYYLTKEVGKTVQCSKSWQEKIEKDIDHVGRFWGWMNRNKLNKSATQYFVPSYMAETIRAKIQEISLRDMIKKGIAKYDTNGSAVFTNNNKIIDKNLLRPWRLDMDAKHLFMLIEKEIFEETGILITSILFPLGYPPQIYP